jgi:hypothetical protein
MLEICANETEMGFIRRLVECVSSVLTELLTGDEGAYM